MAQNNIASDALELLSDMPSISSDGDEQLTNRFATLELASSSGLLPIGNAESSSPGSVTQTGNGVHITDIARRSHENLSIILASEQTWDDARDAMAERRIDLDGMSYTWEEMIGFYKGWYKEKTIESYWYSCQVATGVEIFGNELELFVETYVCASDVRTARFGDLLEALQARFGNLPTQTTTAAKELVARIVLDQYRNRYMALKKRHRKKARAATEPLCFICGSPESNLVKRWQGGLC